MKKVLFLFVAVCLAAVPALAQFQQLIEIRVKPGQEMAFESYVKKIKEGSDKIGSPMSWAVFSVAVGRDGPTYRVALPFAKWAERDRWLGAREVLVQAFGEQQGAKIYSDGTSAIASSSSRIWEVVDEGTANPQSAGDPIAPYYDVTIRHIKPEMVDEYRGLLRRFKSAYEASDQKPSVTRWVLRYGTGNGTTFRRTQPFQTWAEGDSWNPAQVIARHFGDDGPLLFQRLNQAVSKSEHFVSAHRPDLSRAAAAATSND